MTINKKAIVASILMLIIVFGFLTVRNFREKSLTSVERVGIPIDTSMLRSTTLKDGFAYTGYIDADNSAAVSAKVTAEVVECFFKEGDYVEAGTMIMKLDDSQLRASRESLEMKLNTIKINYDYLETEVRTFSSTNALVKRIKTLESDYAYLVTESRKIETLFQSGAVSKSAYDEIMHKKDLLESQIQEAQAASDSAQAQLKTQMLTADAQVSELEANIDELDLSIENTVIESPISGFIRTLNFDVGDTVIAGMGLAVIDDRTKLKAIVDLSEEDLGRVQLEDVVELSITGQEDIIISSISHIRPGLNTKTRIGQVEVEIDGNERKSLFIGNSVDAFFVMHQIDDAKIIPAHAVLFQNEDQYVYVIEEGKALKRQVEIGTEIDGMIQILSGLGMEEEIAVSNVRKLYDGATIYDVERE